MIIPNLDFGGAQRSFCSLANALSAVHSVTVSVFNTSLSISFPLKPQIVDLEIPAGGHVLAKCYFFIKRCRAVSKLKKDLKIHTTISYLEGANYVNALTGTDRKVLSVRGSMYYDDNIKGLMGFMRKMVFIPVVYRRAEYIVALNNGIKNELTERIGIDSEKVEVIRNFYNVDQIQSLALIPLDKQYDFLEGKLYIIYAGRLASGKGLESILDSFKILRNTHHELVLVLVGDGPLKGEIVKYAFSTGCKIFVQGTNNKDKIKDAEILFLGYQENPYQFIGKASMLLIASTSEGGPNILMESLICETLVVSTDCPYGPAEHLAPELNGEPVKEVTEVSHGILLPMQNNNHDMEVLQQWCKVMSDYLVNEEQRKVIVNRARRWLVKQSPHLILESWKRII